MKSEVAGFLWSNNKEILRTLGKNYGFGPYKKKNKNNERYSKKERICQVMDLVIDDFPHLYVEEFLIDNLSKKVRDEEFQKLVKAEDLVNGRKPIKMAYDKELQEQEATIVRCHVDLDDGEYYFNARDSYFEGQNSMYLTDGVV